LNCPPFDAVIREQPVVNAEHAQKIPDLFSVSLERVWALRYKFESLLSQARQASFAQKTRFSAGDSWVRRRQFRRCSFCDYDGFAKEGFEIVAAFDNFGPDASSRPNEVPGLGAPHEINKRFVTVKLP